jgi:hypothetical protein
MLPKLLVAFNTKIIPIIIKTNNLPLTHVENKLNGEESQTWLCGLLLVGHNAYVGR